MTFALPAMAAAPGAMAAASYAKATAVRGLTVLSSRAGSAVHRPIPWHVQGIPAEPKFGSFSLDQVLETLQQAGNK